ncbi:MAG: transporter [Planctomycetota bacterium]
MLVLAAALVAAPAAVAADDDRRDGGLPTLEEVLAPDLEPGGLDLRYDPATAAAPPLDLGLAARDDVALAALQDEPEAEVPEDLGEDFGDDSTGTDPRGFGNKLMPYYRYAEAKNGVEIQQFVLFGMFGFSPNFAMTYEWPLAKKVDFSDVLGTGIPPGGDPPFPPGGVPPGLLDPSGDETGMGDLNLRFFWKIEGWGGVYGWEDELNPNKGWTVMPIIETTLPTATEDELGGEAWILSPGFAFVTDLPGDPPIGLGFFAAMNFFDFDVFKDDSRQKTRRYRGRWFWMQPLTEPGSGLTSGLYLLTEFQPIYDFENSEFDFWIGPELGKIVKDGFIVYLKPGWGIDPDPEDREFTFEVGVRYFF